MDKYRTLKVEIVGTAPLIMHNGQTADPLNRYAKAMAEISGKRSKTEADLEQMAWLDFIGSLYMGTDGPVVPGRLIEAAIVEGAKKSKLGKLATAGVIVEQNPAVEYEGPRTARELFADEAFRFSVRSGSGNRGSSAAGRYSANGRLPSRSPTTAKSSTRATSRPRSATVACSVASVTGARATGATRCARICRPRRRRSELRGSGGWAERDKMGPAKSGAVGSFGPAWRGEAW